ncbi:MAG: HDIG domain-containing protein [bacterium]|nr:HDIG domain-containing protein [bacterium]
MKRSYSFRWIAVSSLEENLKRLLIIGLATFALVAFLPNPFGNEFADLRVGAVATVEIIAPFDFEILKDPEELSQERYTARENTPPVIEYNDSISKAILQKAQKLHHFFKTEIPKLAKKNNTQIDPIVDEMVVSLWRDDQYLIDRENLWWLIRKWNENEKSILDALDRWYDLIDKLVNRGIAEFPENSANPKITTLKDGVAATSDRSLFISTENLSQELLELLREREPSEEFLRVGYDLIRPLLQPNWYYNYQATQKLRDAAAAAIPSAQGIVLKGEKIVDRGKRIDQTTLQVLKSLQLKQNELLASQGTWGWLLPKIGRGFVVFLLLTLWLVVLLTLRYEKVRKFRDVLLAIGLIGVPEVILVYGISLNNLSIFLFPIAAFILSISILYDVEIALISIVIYTGLMVVLGEASSTLILFTVLSSAVALVFVSSITSRSQLFRSIPVIFIVTAFLIGLRVLTDVQWSDQNFSDLSAGLMNSLASPLIAFGLIVAAEKVFLWTTDLTFIELADFNRPVLRKLALEAPGTFHHSLLVGALSEAAARAIQANPILARCIAYYHDIGKLDLREYFIENQVGIENPHDKMSPLESAKILRKHIQQGIDKAKELKLPDEIIAGIPEHHGTSIMKYFYQKALALYSNEVNEGDYRYSGPKPKSKETAILMLADSCEAISRTLKNPSRLEIRKAIREIIQEKVSDGQLVNSSLTFTDLKRIETAFVTVLDGILHKRIVYPSSVKKIEGFE